MLRLPLDAIGHALHTLILSVKASLQHALAGVLMAVRPGRRLDGAALGIGVWV
jgi:hypothetical protein